MLYVSDSVVAKLDEAYNTTDYTTTVVAERASLPGSPTMLLARRRLDRSTCFRRSSYKSKLKMIREVDKRSERERERSTMSADRVDSGSTLPEGTFVKLENLQNATHLNGNAGKVIGLLPNGRYEVELLHSAQRLSLKRANLQVMNTSSVYATTQERTCLGCFKVFPTEQLHNCSRCRMARYCSKVQDL